MNFYYGLDQKRTYWVEQDHAFIHDLQMAGHVLVVILELINQVFNFDAFDFDYERVRQLDVLRRDDQVVGLRQQNLDVVDAVAQVVVAHVQRLLLHNLVRREVLLLQLVLARREAFDFLVEAAVRRAGALLFLFDDEVGLRVGVFLDQRELADVAQDLDARVLGTLPLLHVVRRRLVLQPL